MTEPKKKTLKLFFSFTLVAYCQTHLWRIRYIKIDGFHADLCAPEADAFLFILT